MQRTLPENQVGEKEKNMAISKKLKERWVGFNAHQLLEETNYFSVSPFGLTDEGLHDFRGLVMIGGESDLNIFADFVVKNSDFSGSDWQKIRLWADDNGDAPVFENVKFNDAKFYDCTAKDVQYLSCDFDNTSLKYVQFSDCIFKNCVFKFKKSKIAKLTFYNAKLMENCQFFGEFYHIDFCASNLKDCQFSGTLYLCRFQGLGEKYLEYARHNRICPPEKVENRMDNVDFSQAELKECLFEAYCYLDKIKVSDKNCLVKITQEFYDELCRLIRKNGDLEHIPMNDEKLKTVADEMLGHAKLFFKPQIQKPYEIVHCQDFNFKHTSDEYSQYLYNLVCKAATVVSHDRQ